MWLPAKALLWSIRWRCADCFYTEWNWIIGGGNVLFFILHSLVFLDYKTNLNTEMKRIESRKITEMQAVFNNRTPPEKNVFWGKEV